MEDQTNYTVSKLIQKQHKHAVIKFLPKYHPELNPIENVWMFLKQKFRMNQDFKIKKDLEMIHLLNNILDNISIDTIRKYINSSILYCHAYHTSDGEQSVMNKLKDLKRKRSSHRGAASLLTI